MGAIENIKEVAELIKAYNNIDLNRKIVALEDEIRELNRDKNRLQDRVEEQERALKFMGELKAKDGLLWHETDPIPFCRACWDSKRSAIHLNRLIFTKDGNRYECPICRNLYHPRPGSGT